jgi:hypothetical protein
MKNFQRIGAQVPFGQVELGIDEFRAVHELAAGEAWWAAGSYETRFDTTSDVLRYGFYFRGDQYHRIELPDRFVMVQLSHDSEPDSCRLSVSVRSFQETERNSNKLVRYIFDVLGNEVLEAKKAVYLVLGSSAISFDERGQPIETVTTQRKMYERPLRQGESQHIARILSGAAKRALVTAAR